MKILMYGWEFPPKISGGLGVACSAIVHELSKKGVDLTLVLPQVIENVSFNQVNFVDCPDINIFDESKAGGIIDIMHPNIFIHLHPYQNSNNFPKLLSNETVREFLEILSKVQLLSEIKRMVKDSISHDPNDKYEINLFTEVVRYGWFAGEKAKDIECDVIHAHDWLTILAALEAKNYNHKPIVFHVHSLETDRGGLMFEQRIFALEKYGMEQANRIIAVSQYTKDNIVNHYGIDSEKIAVVHNGIYYDQLENSSQSDDRPQMVLFLGRITYQKGPYYFIETAKKVLEKKPNVQFVLVGTGDLLADMIEHVAGLKIGRNVHFTGFLDKDNVSNIFNLADVYVMPSVSEPFGLSALEALAADVPAVISNQSGVTEVLKHSLVADFWDIENMAAKIIALLDSPRLRQAALDEARDYLPSISWDKTAERIINVYKEIN